MKQFDNYCFVIQPISDEKFTKSFTDVFEPAIKAANLSAYRIDLDPYVKNIIEEIEKNINEAALCLVDIPTDNPNVWYELGYAYAKNKAVVMVCDESRESLFPFDISNKSIIKYKTQSTSDFKKLSADITQKITSYLELQEINQKIIDSSLKENEGLQPFAISLLAVIAG